MCRACRAAGADPWRSAGDRRETPTPAAWAKDVEGGDTGGGDDASKLGTVTGVFLPCVQNILGVILFLRLSAITGEAGVRRRGRLAAARSRR